MAKPKACKDCKTLYEGGDTCPSCGSKNSVDSWKGKLVIVNPENSEIAKKIKVTKKGTYAIKTR